MGGVIRGKSVDLGKERFVVDDEGNRIAVIINMEPYQKLREAEEELGLIRAYDNAKASKEESIPFEQAVREIEKDRE